MARLYRASITPTKDELLEAWVPGQPWFTGSGEVVKVAAYRLDDPAGEVGIEGYVVRAGTGPFLHLVWTYRGAPLPGAEEHLVATMAHSVLGERWVYDAEADPVAVATLTAAIRGEVTQGLELFGPPERDVDGGANESDEAELVARPPVMSVVASAAAVAGSPSGPLEFVHVLEPGRVAGYDEATLVGTWPDADPAVLAYLALPT